jgi:hypothetical protein
VSYTQLATGSGKWGLWLPGELLIFVDTGSTWIVEHDGRIPQRCVLRQTTSTTAIPTSAAFTKITNFVLVSGNAGLQDLTNWYIDPKRTCDFRVWGKVSLVSCDNAGILILALYAGTTESERMFRLRGLAQDNATLSGSAEGSVAPAAHLNMQIYAALASTGTTDVDPEALESSFAYTEVLS